MKQPQPLGGLSRFGASNPCKSAAFLSTPARLIASVRSGPGAILLAASSAASASISRSIFGRGFLTGRAMVLLVLWLMFEFGFAAWRRTRCGVLLPGQFRLGGGPGGGVGIERINRLNSDLSVCALWTSVGPALETFGPR